MSNMRAQMAAELDALKDAPRTGGGNTKGKAARVTMVYEPAIEAKYVKEGSFSWALKKPNGTEIPYNYSKIKGVFVGQGFTWGTLAQDEVTQKWARGCSVSSHVVGKDDDGNPIRGNGHWNIPYWDHNMVVEKYDPIGTKIDEETKEAMKCGDCILKSKDPETGVVRTCKDNSGLFFYVTQVFDPKKEEYVSPEVINDQGKIVDGPLLIKLRSFRGDFDYFRNYMTRIWREHGKMLDEIVTELSAGNPDKWTNHKLNYREDLDDELCEAARTAYTEDVERWDTKRKEDWEKRKAALDAEDPERAKRFANSKPAADKPEPKASDKVTDIKPKADAKASAKGAQPPKEEKPAPSGGDEEEPIPF